MHQLQILYVHKVMLRRYSYALTAGVLSIGCTRRCWVSVVARSVLFAAFGYILGRQADELAELSADRPAHAVAERPRVRGRLHAEIKRSQRYREPLSLLFLDLDGLKNINDRHGHRAGSEALREVAGVIRAELRETDTGARWGGDEFTDHRAEYQQGRGDDDLPSAFARAWRTHAGDWPITASIGVATLDSDDRLDACGCAWR